MVSTFLKKERKTIHFGNYHWCSYETFWKNSLLWRMLYHLLVDRVNISIFLSEQVAETKGTELITTYTLIIRHASSYIYYKVSAEMLYVFIHLRSEYFKLISVKIRIQKIKNYPNLLEMLWLPDMWVFKLDLCQQWNVQ